MKNVILRGITIDNGGSEVRVLPLDGRIPEDLLCIPNAFYSIPEKYFRVKEVEDPRALCVFKKAPKPEYLGIFASGLTGRSYSSASNITMNNMENKTGSLSYYQQFLFSIARDAINSYLDFDQKDANKVYNGNPLKQEYHYVIVTCIPIKEHSGDTDCAEAMREALVGTYEVEYPLIPGQPKLTFIIQPKYFGVTPEGGIVMTSLRSLIEPEDITLVADMGNNTFDIELFKGTSLLGKVRSSQYAGQVLVGEVRSALEEKGHILTDEQAQRAVETNIVKRGALDIDVKDIIDEQRAKFVHDFLRKEVLQVLNRNGFNASQVRNFVPVGAPMQDKGPKSIRTTMIRECGLKDARVLETSVPSRYANVASASIFTKKLFKLAEKELLAKANALV